VLYIFLWTFSAVAVFLYDQPLFNVEPIMLFYIVGSIAVYIIGYKALSQPEVFFHRQEKILQQDFSNTMTDLSIGEQLTIPKTTEKYKTSGLTSEQVATYRNKLVTFMALEKPFLNPELTLDNLADALEMHPHHLSQVINQSFSQNFYEFINSNRVEEAKLIIESDRVKTFTILAIALESGFNSKTTFNVSFKKFTGITPSAYLKQVSAGK